MFDLSQHGMSHDQVLRLIQSARGIQDMRYRIDVLSSGVKDGELPYTSCFIECNGLGDVKHYAKITADALDIDYQRVELQPVMFLPHQGVQLEFPFPPLSPVSVVETIDSARTVDIEAYDKTVRIQENSIGRVPYFPRGTVYTAAAEQLLYEAGYDRVDIEPSGLTMGEDREDWEESDEILSIVNELLSEIGYLSLAVDRQGVVYARKYREPDASLADIHYRSGMSSVIGVSKSVSNDGYRVPNRFVGIVHTAEMDEAWRYEYTNTDPSSPSSVENVGYVITEVAKYNNVADYATLRDNVHRRALEVGASYEYVTLSTAVMPHHEVRELVTVSAQGVQGLYEETGWRIERFAPGGWMEHTLRRLTYS